MVSQHTEGPWNVRKHSGGDLVVATKADQGDNGYALALAMFTHEVHGDDHERLANARLMACAPDLLAAIEEALQDINFSRSKVDGKSMTDLSQHVYLRLITARDKARGVVNGQ